ncbi:DUF3152 domain-containing protein [Streptomyces sp. NPDC007084]|uniref:DUF3152 domain-containing protein n=1 Tax=Streptomyces sp. NPDC007084 TaxID=3154313 RepID=UPI003456288B
MGRHSRRGRADQADTSRTRAVPGAEASPEPGPDPVRRAAAPRPGPLGPYPPANTPAPRSAPPRADVTPSHGFPTVSDGTPARGMPRFVDGTPAHGVPRFPDGTPAHGVPRFFDGTPAHGTPRLPDATPAHGTPRFADGTPAHGTPRFADGTPARGVPRVRGGHPEQWEQGGGWGEPGGGVAPQGPPAGPMVPRQRQERPGVPPSAPRQAYVDAFDLATDFDTATDEDDDLFASRAGAPGRTPGPRTEDDPYDFGSDEGARAGAAGGSGVPPVPESGTPDKGRGGKGRAFTGIAAAAVITVLAVVVAGQVATGRQDTDARARSAAAGDRVTRDPASRGDGRPTQAGRPSTAALALTYDQKMAKTYALGPKLKGPGKFDAVPGFDKAPGKGRKYVYRIDVEQGLGLDGALFAEAVQKTLNDKRSWAHGGARTFERISSGKPDFVITLASPGTTATWCAKSGLDTTEDNVSCDSASTERVMINAYRWAQGSVTYGDKIHSYRQMLINHEVGHRLGYGHVSCTKDGALAPVMQQQTKFLDHDGIHCRPNPWAYPGS